jgi:hypothetical protein
MADAADVRSAVVKSLAASPVSDEVLQRSVWTFVAVERDAGETPTAVIVKLTELFDEARISPVSVYQARRRQVMRWCVEAYFGHLAGDVSGPDALRSDSGSFEALQP